MAMRLNETKTGTLLIVAFCTLLALFLLCENSAMPAFQACVDQYNNSQGTTGPETSVFARTIEAQTICSLHTVDRHNGIVAAVAGCIVALFTFTLWRSTEKLWKAGQASLEATERAFVYIDGFNVELTTLADSPSISIPESLENVDKGLYVTRFALQPRWKNGGNTPTRNMKLQVHCRGPGGSLAADFAYDYPEATTPFFVAPHAVESSEVIEISGINDLIKNGTAGAVGAAPVMFVYGRADYEDVFGKSHYIQWCYRIRPDRHDGKKLRVSLIQSGSYNHSDEAFEGA
jgi:hypothetical protein